MRIKLILHNWFGINWGKDTRCKHRWVMDKSDKSKNICLDCDATRCHCKCGLQ